MGDIAEEVPQGRGHGLVVQFKTFTQQASVWAWIIVDTHFHKLYFSFHSVSGSYLRALQKRLPI